MKTQSIRIMKKNISSPNKLNCLAKLALGCALIGLPLSAHAQIVHVNENFEGFDVGALPTGAGTGWAESGPIGLEVVSSPAIGNRALNITRTGSSSARIETGTGPYTELKLDANKSYEWSFSFYANSSSTDTNGPQMVFYLYSGSDSTNNAFAALRIDTNTSGIMEVKVYTNLGGSTFINGSYTNLGSLAFDTWHDVKFTISTDSSTNIAYTMEAGSLSHAIATPQDSGNTADAVRMGWSPTGPDANFTYDNIYLATVPEPSSVAALLGVAALGLVLLRKRLGSHS